MSYTIDTIDIKAFVEEHADKSVDDLLSWTSAKLKTMLNEPVQGPSYWINENERAVSVNNEKGLICLLSTILYYEWNFPEKSLSKLVNTDKLREAVIKKLKQMINNVGIEWGSLWAIPMLREFGDDEKFEDPPESFLLKYERWDCDSIE